MAKPAKEKKINLKLPDYHMIKVQFPDGDSFEVNSCYGKEGDVLLLDVDWRKHPAWTKKGGAQVNKSVKNIESFNKKFGDLFDVDE